MCCRSVGFRHDITTWRTHASIYSLQHRRCAVACDNCHTFSRCTSNPPSRVLASPFRFVGWSFGTCGLMSTSQSSERHCGRRPPRIPLYRATRSHSTRAIAIPNWRTTSTPLIANLALRIMMHTVFIENKTLAGTKGGFPGRLLFQ